MDHEIVSKVKMWHKDTVIQRPSENDFFMFFSTGELSSTINPDLYKVFHGSCFIVLLVLIDLSWV